LKVHQILPIRIGSLFVPKPLDLAQAFSHRNDKQHFAHSRQKSDYSVQGNPVMPAWKGLIIVGLEDYADSHKTQYRYYPGKNLWYPPITAPIDPAVLFGRRRTRAGPGSGDCMN